jgi:hypothetical protein
MPGRNLDPAGQEGIDQAAHGELLQRTGVQAERLGMREGLRRPFQDHGLDAGQAQLGGEQQTHRPGAHDDHFTCRIHAGQATTAGSSDP